MLWAYVIIFGPEFGTSEEVRAMLDAMPNVYNWYQCLPNAIFFVSDAAADSLKDELHEQKDGRFLVLDVNTDSNGWLPKAAWKFLRHPRRPGDDG